MDERTTNTPQHAYRNVRFLLSFDANIPKHVPSLLPSPFVSMILHDLRVASLYA
jgi:hypothetical protein